MSIPPPGLEQGSQWLQIRKEQPDWVTFWGAGSGMNSTAMTNAARIRFPRERMMYVTFGAAEEDMYPAGDAAVKANPNAERRPGSVYPLGGLGAAVMWIEALKNAQEMHNKVGKAVTGAEFRDGYEALNMTEARLGEIGVKGMVAPFSISCANHEGAGKFAVMQWDGEKFNQVTGWEAPMDPAYIRSLVENSAAKFAAENNITPKVCP